MDDLEAIFSLEENEITADFSLTDEDNLDAVFKIDAAGTTWGSIDGNIANQADLKNELDTLSDQIAGNHSEITNIATTMQGYGDIVTHNVTEFATATEGTLASTAIQPGDNITRLNNNAGYITGINNIDVITALGYVPQHPITPGYGIKLNNNTISTDTTIASKTDIGNAQLTIKRNNQTVGTFSANATEAATVTISVPTTATEIGALPSDTTLNDLATTAQQAAINSGATTANINQITTNTNAILTINNKIPSQASSSNQLADKNFVNSSIATNTANFIGTFNSVAELEAYSGTLTNNDYAFVETTDTAGNTYYDRYKYTTATNPASWIFEYELNNSSFTSNQWAAINSGVTSSDVTLISTATQPGDNVSTLTNDAGYITSASLPTVNNSTIKIQKNSTDVGTFTLNQSSGETINITVPTDTLDLTNGAGYITSAALSGYATETWVNNKGYITGITSSDVTTALGYTPQTELVSGTNIKTINNTSLLGSGNLSISADADNLTITTNANDELQANALIDQNTGIAKVWTGTLAEYNAITTKDADTLYNITDDQTASAYQAYTKSETDDLISENCDGQWVNSSVSMISATTTFNGQTTYEYSLASYLPNDGYNYEVIVTANGETNSVTGTAAEISIGSTFVDATTNRVAYSITRTSSTAGWGWSGIIPIGTDRKIGIRQIHNSSCTCRFFRCKAYRRIGTNS